MEIGQFILRRESMSKSILTPKWLVLGSLELPLASSLTSAFCDLPSVVCRRIQGTGGAGDELDDSDDSDDSGR